MEITNRRTFISKTSLFTTSLILVSPMQIFSKGKAESNLQENSTFSTSIEKKLKVSGFVFQTNGKSPIKNVQMEFWHLSQSSPTGVYKKSVSVDESGRYEISTEMPHKKKNLPRKLYLRIKGQNTSYTTYLVITQNDVHMTDKHWESNNALSENMLYPRVKKEAGIRTINFNLSLNQKS